MENMERELDFAKSENVLLRLYRAFEKAADTGEKNMAKELAISLSNRIPEHKANLLERIDYLRQEIDAASSKEEKAKLIEIGQNIAPDLKLWNERLKKIEKYLTPKEYVKPIGFKLVKKNPVATAAEVQLLISLANKLDSKGLYSEASIIDLMITKEASKSDLFKALKEDEPEKAYDAMTGLSGPDLGLDHKQFSELTSAIHQMDLDHARKMLGVSKNVNIAPGTHNPVTGLPYETPMPKGFCPECGKKLVMRYPGGDPENGPAGLRCPQYHNKAEPCELCPHFFHTDSCKEQGCGCHSSFGTEEQMKEEEEMMKKLYGDDWDKAPDDDPSVRIP